MYSLRQDGRHGKSPWPDDGMSRNRQQSRFIVRQPVKTKIK